MKLTQLKVESKTLKVIAILALTFIAWPDVAFAQQTFPTQMEGEYVCEQRYGCASTFKIFLEADTTDSTQFLLTDSCPNNWSGRFIMAIFQNSSLIDSFTVTPNGGNFCIFRGSFYPNSDSIFARRHTLGCGSGCTCLLEYKCKKVNSTSLSENELEAVQLLPNPVKESLQIKGLQQRLNYRLYNLQGQLLLNGQVQDGNAIEIGNLAPGIYLLQLGEAEKSVWHKVVKE